MSYSYEAEKPRLFTDEGQRGFLNVRDRAQSLLREAGAFRAQEVWRGCGVSDNWQMLACVDRLLELGEIREVTDPQRIAGQHRVFVGVRA